MAYAGAEGVRTIMTSSGTEMAVDTMETSTGPAYRLLAPTCVSGSHTARRGAYARDKSTPGASWPRLLPVPTG